MMLRVRVMTQSLALGIAEFRTMYTLRSWLSGWLLRMLAQVAFFASIGLIIHSRSSMQYLLIGNAVVIVCLEASIVVLSMAGERWQGTLTALLTTPGQPITAYLGRGLNWIVTGVVTSAITLWLLPPIFGIPLQPVRLLACMPILLVIGLASYAYGSFLAGLTLRFPGLDWLVLNVGYLVVMSFAGVSVPVEFWPAPLQVVVQALPVTHGLEAIRGVLAGKSVSSVLILTGQELLVGILWVTAAGISYTLFVNHARRRGSLSRA